MGRLKKEAYEKAPMAEAFKNAGKKPRPKKEVVSKNRTDVAKSCTDVAKHEPSPLDKLLAYRQKGLSYADIGKLVGVTAQSIHARIKEFDDLMPLADYYRQNKTRWLDFLQSQILASLTREELKSMAVRDRILCYGILFDKARIASGEDVLKIDIRMLTGDLEEIRKQKEAILGKLKTVPSPEPSPESVQDDNPLYNKDLDSVFTGIQPAHNDDVTPL